MRLTNITVNEVSLVDKAANKRKFAFMKRDNTQEIIKDEVKEAQKVIDSNTKIDTEPTPEQLAEFDLLFEQVIELAALVKQN